jgi:excisionase family DNA binding protein
MEAAVDEHLITAEEVAELLSLRAQTVRDAAWRGKLPCIRLWAGKKKTLLRFNRRDIEALIRERTVPVRTHPRA